MSPTTDAKNTTAITAASSRSQTPAPTTAKTPAPTTLLAARKYLCSAPRPEAWPDLSDAVIRRLGSSAAPKLTATLEAVRALHPKTATRTGPGRKSNAEHAIHFYEHLLQLVAEDTPEDDEEEEDDTGNVPPSSGEEEDEEKKVDLEEEDEEGVGEGGNDEEEGDAEEENVNDDDCIQTEDHPSETMQPSTEEEGDAEEEDVNDDDCIQPEDQRSPDTKTKAKLDNTAVQAAEQAATMESQTDTTLPAHIKMDHNEEEDDEEEVDVATDGEDTDKRATKKDNPSTTGGRHMDTCDVCTERGDLHVVCSTCNRAFHVDCVRPKLKANNVMLPENHAAAAAAAATGNPQQQRPWRCSHCILLYVSSKNSKQRKLAAAAIRLMIRLRKQHESNKYLPDEETSFGTEAPFKRGNATTTEMEEEEGSMIIQSLSNSDSKKRASAATTSIFDSTGNDTKTPARSSSGEVASPAEGRSSKRCRKQPTLYDPQRGPASRWQTDELKEWKASRAETSDDSDLEEGIMKNSTTKTTPISQATATTTRKDNAQENDATDTNTGETCVKSSRKLARDVGDGVWCNFCKDDPSVHICVFCACRVCFGKHNQTKLLLCDLCDEEYHTFCLDPPLTNVPTAQHKWFCPSCNKTVATRNPDTPRSARRSTERTSARSKSRESTISTSKTAVAVAIPKKSPRTPSPPKRSAVAVGLPVAAVPKKVASAPLEKKKLVGRPRGRPPKNPQSVSPGSIVQSAAAVKKRGRSPSKTRSVSEPPRKRGRPPSAATIAKRMKVEAEARKAARLAAKATHKNAPESSKKKNDVAWSDQSDREQRSIAIESANDSPSKVIQTFPITVSRSGRMVRRSSFHDERHEGEQHLKSFRLGSDSNISPTNNDLPDGAWMGPLPRKPAYAAQSHAIAVSSAAVDAISNNLAAAAARSFAQASLQNQGLPMSSSQTPAAQQQFQIASFSTELSISTTAQSEGVDVNGFDPDASEYSTASYLMQPSNAPDASAYHSDVEMLPPSHSFAQSSIMNQGDSKQPRRKPGARECMQISRRFGVKEIPQQYMEILTDYCTRGKVEHLIRMRERLDEHSRFLESQLAGLEALVLEHGESDVVVPLAPPSPER